MENKAKDLLKKLMLQVSDAFILDRQVDNEERELMYREFYKGLKDLEIEIISQEKEKESVEILEIPNLPKGDLYNPYPRFMYAMVYELYTRDKFFTIYEMMDLTGSSRNQVKLDLERLEQDGFINLIDGYTGERKTRYYKYAPAKLV